MKRIFYTAIVLVIMLSFSGCGNNNKSSTATNKQVKTENKKDTNNKKETKITSGELYEKITSIEKVKSINTIEDTEIGFINLNIEVNVSKDTAIEELSNYTKKVGKIQTNLKDYFINKKYMRITYIMNVDNEMKSVLITYKRENNEYILESTSITDEKYKKAAEALN